ncbi:MAG TPA: nicotinate-nucleotide--dimethylbenzimidazole phosphoribosyltransferase [Elusimicrobia bacterium]|nr:nicotinate-nucleotide--dimethylbenzimidazole phosphoribosyltransferase [Elusimicrobiota bacterium]
MLSKKIEEIVKNIKPLNKILLEQTQERLNNLTKPLGSLGQLEDIAKQLVAIIGKDKQVLKNKTIFTLAGDHGVAEEGISAYPKEVTQQMVYNFINGGAGVNVLARHVGARVVVVDMGVGEKLQVKSEKLKVKKVAYGTRNFTKGPAMTEEEAIKSIEAGIEIVEEEIKNSGIELIGTGDMGIGNTTPSAAIASVVCNVEPETVTGRGTGINDKVLQNKIDVIKRGIEKNKPDSNNGIDILSKLGGYEIGGLAGIMIAGASHRIPVVIDGFISGAAALVADKISPLAKQYWIAAHCSTEPGHKIMLEYLNLRPLLNLNMRLGEGTGSALAMNLIDASLKILNEMATFDSAGVSKKE